MLDWQFNPTDYDPNGFLIPVGKYRVRIEDAEETTSKSSGYPMIKLILKVSGYNPKIWYFLTLNKEKSEYVNQKLGELWNSFDIPVGNLNLESWKGKVGGASIRHELDNNEVMQAKINFFLRRSEVEKLPAWQEKGSNTTTTTTSNNDNIDPVMYEPVPF